MASGAGALTVHSYLEPFHGSRIFLCRIILFALTDKFGVLTCISRRLSFSSFMFPGHLQA